MKSRQKVAVVSMWLISAGLCHAQGTCPPACFAVGVRFEAFPYGTVINPDSPIEGTAQLYASGYFFNSLQRGYDGESCSFTPLPETTNWFGPSISDACNNTWAGSVGFHGVGCAPNYENFYRVGWDFTSLAEAAAVVNIGNVPLGSAARALFVQAEVGVAGDYRGQNDPFCCVAVLPGGSARADARASISLNSNVSVNFWKYRITTYDPCAGGAQYSSGNPGSLTQQLFEWRTYDGSQYNNGSIGVTVGGSGPSFGGGGRGNPEFTGEILVAANRLDVDHFSFTFDQFDFNQDGRFNADDLVVITSWLGSAPPVVLPIQVTGWDVGLRNGSVDQADIDVVARLIAAKMDQGLPGDANRDGVLSCSGDAPVIAGIPDDASYMLSAYRATVDLNGDGTITAIERRTAQRLVAPADITGIGGGTNPPDGQYTVDDLILFINEFGDATGCPGTAPCNPADVTSIGGGPQDLWDGLLTVDDLIVFINAFGDGCL